jgi:hypothetical protein
MSILGNEVCRTTEKIFGKYICFTGLDVWQVMSLSHTLRPIATFISLFGKVIRLCRKIVPF